MRILLLVSFIIIFLSCEDNEVDSGLSVMGPDIFVEKISKGTYEETFADSLPGFKPKDIPLFLTYSNDFKKITYFPVNPISSFMINQKFLGECMLWTIEAIRVTPSSASSLIFPSSVPALVKEEIIENEKVLTRLNQQELFQAYQLYKIWWDQAEDKTFEELRNINPLEGSGFRWR